MSAQSTMHRILATLSVFVLVLSLGLARQAQASPSRDVLQGSIDHCLKLLADPAFANPATTNDIRARIEVEVRRVFDFEEFSARTAGQRWRAFSPEQQHRFSEAFAKLILNTYLGQLKGYNGEQVLYTGERSSSSGKVEQETQISLKDGRTIPVSYRMMPKNGTWVVYDVLVEGVSLVKNYRTQFQDILQTSSPDELISRIEAKSANISNGTQNRPQ